MRRGEGVGWVADGCDGGCLRCVDGFIRQLKGGWMKRVVPDGFGFSWINDL